MAIASLTVPAHFDASAAPPPPVVPASLPPKIELLQPGLKLTLLAEHPSLVTPTGIAVDAQGRIWVVACHTHFRPEGYQGPARDELLVFDRNGTGRRVFYSKTSATMNVALGGGGWVYLAERGRILRVKDTNEDGKGDREEAIATLATTADYPHNGLSGMAWLPGGDLLFSLGENFGKPWTLTGTDGAKLSGRGEGGVFRCRPDGTGLRRVAHGFWNPFGLLARADGELFAVDNDPGSRPPCRLLHVVEGADYGFQWVYGSAPVHPFVAWNGELRGTLGMIHPSGEGPCSIAELGGGVVVPSWSHHRIDYFPLARQGASYRAQRTELVRGGEHFRPSCLVAGPDGAFYFNDWVHSSYTLHGRGRLWKLEVDRTKAAWVNSLWPQPNAASRLADTLRAGSPAMPQAKLFDLARATDAHLADAALFALARTSVGWTPGQVRAFPARDRVWALLALRRADPSAERWVREFLADPDPELRFECLRWISDSVMTGFSSEVEAMLLQPNLDFRLFEAALACWNTLRGKPEAGVVDAEVLMERVARRDTPARLRAFALRLAPAAHPRLTVALLQELLAFDDPLLSAEVVRTLGLRPDDAALGLLSKIAGDRTRPAALRADALAGLAGSTTPAHEELTLTLAQQDDAGVRKEALRALRFRALKDAAQETLRGVARRFPDSAALVGAIQNPAGIGAGRPALTDTQAWSQRLAKLPGPADIEAGRRLFFHPRVALCSNCHRHSGRGNVVGPDLTLIARQGDESALLRSLLEPSRDVAPQYYATSLVLKDGSEFTGILLRSSSVDVFRDLLGKERTFKPEDIVKRAESHASPMPSGLVDALTDVELRDLLAFLSGAGPVQAPPR